MDNLILDGGLDLTTARPATLPGRIKQCLNYEVGWQRGYSRIDGFERYDGRISPSNTTGWVFEVAAADITGTFVSPEPLRWDNAEAEGDSGSIVGLFYESGTDTWRFFIVFRSGKNRPEFGDTITGVTSGASFLSDNMILATIQTFPEYYGTHLDYINALNSFAIELRDEVKPVPGGGTIVGLHYHEDQLFAVRDMLEITVPVGDELTLVPGMYVYNDAGQIGLVMTSANDDRKVNITAIDQDGFTLVATDPVHIALTIRFTDGSGAFNEDDSVLSDDVTAYAANVGVIDRRDGSFDSGNALGVAAFTDGPDGSVTIPTLPAVTTFNNQTVTGAMAVESVMFPAVDSAFLVEAVSTKAERATLWKSTEEGWTPATSGAVVQFTDGKNDPLDTSSPVTVVLPAVYPNVVTEGTGFTWTGDVNDIKIKDTVNVITRSLSGGNPVGNRATSAYLEASDFSASLLDSDEIVGVDFVFTSKGTGSGFGNWKARLLGGVSYGIATIPNDPALQDVEVGTWSVGLTPAIINASGFGTRFYMYTDTPSTSITLDSVGMVVTVTRLPGAKLYLYNGGVDIGYISVASTVIQSGEWGGAEPPPLAAGYFRLSDWSITEIPSGTVVWTQPGGVGGGGLEIATLSGNVSVPTLPGSLLLAENNSKYEMISYNFFATEEQNAIYGVNGAGPAFWYDGTTLDFILTGVDIEDDKPRHLGPHVNRLLLGYIWGEAYLSSPDPLDFSADTGLAASFGFGDKITGIMPISGKASAVFTESTVNSLIGAPEDFGGDALQYVEQTVINHKVGAIEYTVQNIGNRPIFASFRGIETLETMDQYSDFFTAPLTYPVSPWLLRRLQSAAGVEAANQSVVNSVVIRNKNQYRLFFADGWLLTLTYVGPEKEPQNTTQQYWFESDRGKYSRCFATASGVTTDGRDRAFFSTEELPDAPAPTVKVLGALTGYVYELDRGRSFDGGTIEAEFELTYYYAQDEQGGPAPQHSKRDNVFHLHGTCAGTADLRVARSLNYENLDDPVLPYESIPFGHDMMVAEDEPRAKYTKGRLTGRGFAISVAVSHISDREFSHNIQMMSFLDDKTLRQNL